MGPRFFKIEFFFFKERSGDKLSFHHHFLKSLEVGLFLFWVVLTLSPFPPKNKSIVNP